MTFFDFPDEKRADWRNDEVTQAFIRWMAEEKTKSIENAAGCVRANDHNNAAIHVGEAEAFTHMLKVANTRKDR